MADARLRAQLLERLFELAVSLSDAMDRGLEARGLTRARGELIWRLRREGPQTQRALSRMLACTPRNVTGLVDALESSGHVRRQAHPTDRRATLVGLTRKGTAEAERMEAGYAAAAERLLGGLESSELTGFASALDHILATMREPAESDGMTRAS